MPPESNGISRAEINLRLHAPKFYKELIDSRTASLIEENNPEALIAWKQELQRRDQLFADMLQGAPELRQQPLDKENVKEALKAYAKEFSRLNPEAIDAEHFEASFTEIMKEQAVFGRDVEAMKNEPESPQQEIKIPPPKIDPPSNS